VTELTERQEATVMAANQLQALTEIAAYNLSKTYTIHPARYAKDKMAIHCKPDGSGWKTLAALVIGQMKGVRYSNRERAYIVSPTCAKKFEQEMARIKKQREATQ
jgi:hypothetical protein